MISGRELHDVAEDADHQAEDEHAPNRRRAGRSRRQQEHDTRRTLYLKAMAESPRPLRSPRSRAGLREVGYLPGESTALVVLPRDEARQAGAGRGPGRRRQDRAREGAVAVSDRTLVRLQCYEGLDEAKALYEWNYRKQLLRIQTESDDTGWQDVQDDIFGEEFLLQRPLMTAIASPDPVVLLIDEIDKTDQEFEAMLLELLSDFQISIPELGRIEASTHPVVLLTSNNTRELTEALKRRCLYLWLDYPDLEHELEIVRLHSPELDETIARKLVEIVHQVRELDLKKPPSIAESIDWARALLLLGAEDIDAETFRETMSVIVKHRTDLDTVAARVGVKLEPAADARRSAAERATRRSYAAPARPGGFEGQLLEFAEDLRDEGVAIGTSRCSTRSRRSPTSPGPSTRLPRGAGGDARQVARGPARVRARVRPLLLPRRRGRGGAPARSARRAAAPRRGRRADIDLDELRQQIAAALRDGSDAALRDLARLAIAAFGRGEGSGVLGVDVQRIRRALGLRTEPQPDLPDDDPRRQGVPREQLRRFEQHLRRELERDLIERTESLPPKRPLTELDRALPTGPIQDLAAVHRVVAQLKRRLATQGHELQGPQAPRPRRRPPHDARVAADRRRPDRAQVPAAATATARDLRPVRRLDERDQRQHVLPQRPARAPRRVPQAALVRVHRADLRGDRGVRARARLPRRERSGVTRRRRRRHLRLHRLRPGVDRVPGADRGRAASARDRDRARRRPHERPPAPRRRVRRDHRARPAARSGSIPSRACTGTTATA